MLPLATSLWTHRAAPSQKTTRFRATARRDFMGRGHGAFFGEGRRASPGAAGPPTPADGGLVEVTRGRSAVLGVPPRCLGPTRGSPQFPETPRQGVGAGPASSCAWSPSFLRVLPALRCDRGTSVHGNTRPGSAQRAYAQVGTAGPADGAPSPSRPRPLLPEGSHGPCVHPNT